MNSGLIGEDQPFRDFRQRQENGEDLDDIPPPPLPQSTQVSKFDPFIRNKRDVKNQSPEAMKKTQQAQRRSYDEAIKRSDQLLSMTYPSASISSDTLHYLMYKSPWAAIRNHLPLEHALKRRSVPENMSITDQGNDYAL